MSRPLILAHLLLALLLPGTPARALPAAGAPVWAPAAEAAIHPGVRTTTAGGGQCTANFVFTDPTGAVYLGQSAHCGATGTATQTDGCRAATVPLHTAVEVDGATRPGVLVYDSWRTMQAAGEDDPDICTYNDFALVRLGPVDHAAVNPSLPFYGGPHGISPTTTAGETVYTYGSSSLRPGDGSPKSGTARGQSAGGWTHDVFTPNVGVPGDSGSGFLNGQGQAFGTLTTLELLPSPGSNGVSDLTLALAYLTDHTDLDVTMADGTLQFDPGGATVDSAAGAPRGEPGAMTRRLTGDTRIETAVAVSRSSYAAGAAGAVVLGRADVAADALAGTPLAAAVDGPLLLTTSDRMHPAAAAEVRRVLPEGGTVWVLGGTGALSPGVEADLQGYDVRRLAGATRIETAIEVARQVTDDPAQVLLADGLGFADALVAGPAAVMAGGVVLLTDGARPDPAVEAYLSEHADAEVITIGSAASTAHPGHQRIAGSDDSATSALVAQAYADDAATVGVARVDVFADALAGGAHAARAGAPILLTAGDSLAPVIGDHLADRAASIDLAILYGGTAALSVQVEEEIRAAIR